MKQFSTITSMCLPIRTENIDTDQIIPAQFLKTTSREGLGKFLFYNWRFDEKGKPKKSHFHELNHESVKILLAGDNFGTGSSREHAAWALLDYGFKVIISSSIGDIFYSNSLKNGLLPVILKPEELVELFKIVIKQPDIMLTVNLEKQSASIYGINKKYYFPIDAFRKTCLLKGVDELGYIQSFEKQINEFEKKHTSFIVR